MGQYDRDYISGKKKSEMCPMTGHWVGVSNCSECNYNVPCKYRPRSHRRFNPLPEYEQSKPKEQEQKKGEGINNLPTSNTAKPTPSTDKPPISKPQSPRLIVDNSHPDCPIKREDGFPCSKCAYSISTSERKVFLNTTTWWYCKYPNIENFSLLQEKEMTALLNLEYRNQGYTLSKDEDFVYLSQNGKNCGVFSLYRASIRAVEKYIENNRSALAD